YEPLPGALTQPIVEATIACPACGAARRETMPTDTCVIAYQCTACEALLRPKPGSCCVFCSYGSTPCPPMQTAAAP
ncbi:MAG: GDCCVxC domain-containing (seleno)protein, partial [Stellaceae bacterium]